MEKNISTSNQTSLWPLVFAGAIRAAFGLVWGLDAYFKWQPDFYNNYQTYISSIISGQPSWLMPWFNFWNNLIALNPDVFSWATRIIETIIALGLLLGFGRKWIYMLGGFFALLIWAIPEGFGGPYTPGATDVGAGLIYAFVFLALILLDYVLGRSPYSLDFYIERGWPGWKSFAEWAPASTLKQEPRYLPWPVQILVILVLIAMLIVFLIILGSELSTASTSGTGSLEWFRGLFATGGLKQVFQLV
jgi:nitrite reductase (NO-forming)